MSEEDKVTQAAKAAAQKAASEREAQAEKDAADKAAADKEAADKAKAPKTRSYVVQKGAIAPKGGSRGALVKVGETVELTDKEARHYIKLGRLAPSVPDDEDE